MGISAYSKTIGSPTGPVYKTIVGQKQVPITNLVLPCDTSYHYGEFSDNQYPLGTFVPPAAGLIWQQGTRGSAMWPYDTTRVGGRALAYNRARARFLDKIKLARAQGLTALAERKKTTEMINKRMQQLLRAATALRRGDFRTFLNVLNVKPLAKHRNKGWNRPKELGGLWLEYWFGWAPTISDIYSLVDAYTNEIKPCYLKAGSRATDAYTYKGGNLSYATTTAEAYTCTCNIGASVRVTNNDLLDLNEAGLLNPAQTALELVPFSWLAGWFMNLSSVFGSFTDTIGLRFENGWISEKTDRFCSYKLTYVPNGKIHGLRNYRTLVFKRSRFTELPSPTFEWSLPKGLSVTRGATLSALVFQLFAPTGRR